jgi:hypothetical protein
MRGHRALIILCLAIAVLYAALDARTAFGLWFNGIGAWSALFRPFPDWGQGPELYGALLPAKWIGTRVMWYAGALIAVTFFALLFRAYWVVAAYLFEGAFIELLDVFWLFDGRSSWGWSTPGTGEAIATKAAIALVLIVTAWLLWRSDPSRDRLAMPYVPPAEPLLRTFSYWCYFVAFCFLSMKALFAYWWWFHSIWFWSAAFRQFPDWGQGADLFGAILPARWIGTRNLAYALIILVALIIAMRRRGDKLLAFLLLQGVVIEFFDGLWLAIGKYNEGWQGPGTDFYMTGGFLWFPFLITAGIFMMSRDRLEELAARHERGAATTARPP